MEKPLKSESTVQAGGFMLDLGLFFVVPRSLSFFGWDGYTFYRISVARVVQVNIAKRSWKYVIW